MKKIIVFLLAMVYPLLFFGQSSKALDDAYGFRDAKFEMPITSFKDLKKLYEGLKEPTIQHLEQLYCPTNQSLKFGEYDLKSITYRFIDDQLASVILSTKGNDNCRGVLKILQRNYGKGERKKYSYTSLDWSGEKVAMSFNFDPVLHNAQIFLFCKKFSEKQLIRVWPIDKSKKFL